MSLNLNELINGDKTTLPDGRVLGQIDGKWCFEKEGKCVKLEGEMPKKTAKLCAQLILSNTWKTPTGFIFHITKDIATDATMLFTIDIRSKFIFDGQLAPRQRRCLSSRIENIFLGNSRHCRINTGRYCPACH